jgi:hypothetical protein
MMKKLNLLLRLAALIWAACGTALRADGPYNNPNGPAFIVVDFCSNGIGDQRLVNPTNGLGFQFTPFYPAIPQLTPDVFDIGLDIDADGTVDRWLSQEPATILANGANADVIQYGNNGWVRAYFYQLSQYIGRSVKIRLVDRSTNYYLAVKSIRVNGADGLIVTNALRNGFFEEGLAGWTVKESSVADHASLIFKDKNSNYLTYGTNFFTTRIDPASTDTAATAVIESDAFVLPPITSFIYGNVSGGVSEFVNNPGANGSDNASGVYLDLGTTTQDPDGKFQLGHDLPVVGFWPGPAGQQNKDIYSIFINTTGLEGRRAQVVGFDNSAIFSIALDGFRANWDWEESIIKNGGFDQGIPTPETNPGATDWFQELGDGALTASSHPSGKIPNWKVTKSAGATGDVYFFDASAEHRHMSGRTFVGTGGGIADSNGNLYNTGIEIRSDVFTVTPIPSPTNSVFVGFASAQATDRIRYEDDGSNKYYGIIELVVDVNTNGVFGDTGDFHYVQHNQALGGPNQTTAGGHDAWHFPAYRFYVKPEHQGLKAQFHAGVHYALADSAPKNGWSWIAIDDLFVWDGTQASLAFPNSDFEQGSLTNWTPTYTSIEFEPTWTNWLSGNVDQYYLGTVNNLMLNDHPSYFDGNFAADSGPNEISGSNSDSNTGDITSIAFTLPKLAPAGPSVLKIQSVGGVLTLSWTGPGVLQSATSLKGTFVPVLNATNPYTVPTSTAARFYRLR